MANKKMTFGFYINGIKESIKDITILKENLSSLDKNIITAKFTTELTKSFRSFSDIPKPNTTLFYSHH